MSCVGVSFRRQPSAPQRFFAAAANESEAVPAPSVGSSGMIKVGLADDESWGDAPPKEEELEDIF